jgi:hypothetical protein
MLKTQNTLSVQKLTKDVCVKYVLFRAIKRKGKAQRLGKDRKSLGSP